MTALYLNGEHEYHVYNRQKKDFQPLFTGYGEIDIMCRPRCGHLTIIGAPTNHGKSILLKNFAVNMFRGYRESHFLYYSFEERYIETIDDMGRMLFFDEYADDGRDIPRDFYDTKVMNEDNADGEIYARHFSLINKLNSRMHIFDKRINAEELKSHIRSVIDKFGGIKAVFIDYLQDMKASREREHHAEMEEMTIALDEMSREYGISIIVPAQFRQNQHAETKWDIIGIDRFYGSHSVAKKADVIYSVFNNTVFEARKNGMADVQTYTLEIDVLKQRKQAYFYNYKYKMNKNNGRLVYDK